MRFFSNFGCKLIFMCSVNFWHQQNSNSLFKGSIGHVTNRTQAVSVVSLGVPTVSNQYILFHVNSPVKTLFLNFFY